MEIIKHKVVKLLVTKQLTCPTKLQTIVSLDNYKIKGMQFEVVTAVKMSMLVFWAIIPYSLKRGTSISEEHTAFISRPKG
jgi:Flp pilus assembly protein TadG